MIATMWNTINLVGDGHFRCQTIPMPTEVVRSLLPWGFELGPQQLTPAGTHPVVLFFQEMVRAHMTVPVLLPNMTYEEQILGVPYAYVGNAGPFFYMPNLFLSEWLPTIGGVAYWGFNKHVANIRVSANTWEVFDPGDNPVVSFRHRNRGGEAAVWKPVSEQPYPFFRNFCGPNGLMVQPLLSQLPGGYQVFPVCSNFDKLWEQAQIRPIEGQVRIEQSFVPTLPCGQYPNAGWAPSIERSAYGCFEVLAPWRLTIPYLPTMAPWIPPTSLDAPT